MLSMLFRYNNKTQVSRNFTFTQSATEKLGRDKCLIIYALENGKDSGGPR